MPSINTTHKSVFCTLSTQTKAYIWLHAKINCAIDQGLVFQNVTKLLANATLKFLSEVWQIH